MKRWGVAGCSALALVAACTGGHVGAGGSPASPAVRGSLAPSAVSSPSPVVGGRLLLTADLRDRPAPWHRVFLVAFGRRRDQLGFKAFHESVNSQPSSFAVAGDGSFWIADRWKRRLAHYSAKGRFLGQSEAPKLSPRRSIGRHGGRLHDIVESNGGLFALMDPTGGPVGVLRPGKSIEYVRPRIGGRDLWVAEIFPSRGPLIMLVGGFVAAGTGFAQDGPTGFFQWEPPGLPVPVSGLPDGKGSFLDLQRMASPAGGDQDFELRYSGPRQRVFVQPFRIDVRAGGGPAGRSIPAEIGPGNLLMADDDVLMYVMLTPSRPRDARRFGGGRWVLRLGKSAVLWERLPNPGLPDEPQSRHLALGPDGAIYLMVATRGGMLILKRP